MLMSLRTSISGDASHVNDHSGKSWSLWPFTKSRSKKESQKEHVSNKESDLDSGSEVDVDKDPLSKSIKLKKALTPTPEQLESLNLTEGKNTVTFKFSTAVLGNQQVCSFLMFIGCKVGSFNAYTYEWVALSYVLP